MIDGQAHGGVGLARRALKAQNAIKREWNARIARPLGVADVVILHLVVHERVVSAVVLGRKRARPLFAERELETLAQLAPVLSVCDAWLQQRACAPAGMPVAVRCLDGRLTPRQQTVVEQVALGHADHEIAAALQISPRLHEISKYDGAGMGLAIAKRIVELHHGSLDVEAAPNAGCTFHVTLRVHA
ncbi:MAG TPA: ATP-binding protein [Polyangiales bacterium]|nr:ATP-binding protein [Polyangiales bacterium]